MTDQPDIKARLRSLPAIGKLLQHDRVKPWSACHPEARVIAALRRAVDGLRDDITAGRAADGPLEDRVIAVAGQWLEHSAGPSLRRVVNATGIVLHTGLGRAPLAAAAVEALVTMASGYSNLELDLESGQRGKRTGHVSDLLRELTGAEAATVVNNNAAATLLILNTVVGAAPLVGRRTRRRDVIVSRGQLVEIGGSYRLPDIMKASGARLIEVGTTNRTRLRDYEQAITEHTAALMRVHTSNYRIAGFSEEVAIDELVALGHDRGLAVIDDLGSGALLDLNRVGLRDEPQVADSVRAGADAICFSGDKLLGGPQAGVILGTSRFVNDVMRNPLMRTYRIDKLTVAALEATLRCYVDPDLALTTIPTLGMLSASPDELARRADALLRDLTDRCPAGRFAMAQDVSYAGGGSLPAQALPTTTVRWTPPAAAHDIADSLRSGNPAIVARVHKNAIVFDPRTLDERDTVALVDAVVELCRNR